MSWKPIPPTVANLAAALAADLAAIEAGLKHPSSKPAISSAEQRLGLHGLCGDGDLANGAQGSITPALKNAFGATVEAGLTEEMLRFVASLGEFRLLLERVSVLLPHTSDSCKAVTISLSGLLLELTPLSFQLVAALLRNTKLLASGEGAGHDVE